MAHKFYVVIVVCTLQLYGVGGGNYVVTVMMCHVYNLLGGIFL